jgi:hypothetical protein
MDKRQMEFNCSIKHLIIKLKYIGLKDFLYTIKNKQQSAKMNIVSIIETNPLTKLNQDYQNKFIQKIQSKFSTDHQQLFIGSFYGYLNYNSKTDFIIDLNDIWKWLGFSRKADAKKVLTKHFIENVDFRLATEVAVSSSHGGQNKENILMNLVTFKKLCLKSNTSKADSIHNYFIELEEVLQEIVNEESNELRNQLSIKESELTNNRHSLLLEKMSNKNVVYLIKIYNYENGNFIIKLGQTGNLRHRMQDHNCNYTNPELLDVFEVFQHVKFEQFLLNSTEISKHKTKDNFPKAKEHVLIDQLFTYNHIIDIINQNISYYQFVHVNEKCVNIEHEIYLTNKLLDIKKECLLIDQKKINLIEDTMNKFNITFQESNTLLNTKSTEVRLGNTDTDIVIATRIPKKTTPRLQQIDPHTFEIIHVYESVSECKFTESSIRKAVKDKTLYKNFRWNLVPRNLDFNIKYDIGNTIICQKQSTGYIAKLDTDHKEILQVYKNQKSAALHNNTSQTMMSRSIINKSTLHNYLYKNYDDISADLKETYEQNNELPLEKNDVIEQILANTKQIVKTFKTRQECCKYMHISTSTLRKYLNTNQVYYGFLYKIKK